MLKKQIKYTDYNGTERDENFWFNLSKAGLMDMGLMTPGGFNGMVMKIIAAQATPSLVTLFKDIIFKAYGEKSADGKRFIKSKELSTAFSQTEAYSNLYMELVTNTEAAIEFINGIVPKDLAEEAAKQQATESAALPVA